MNREFWGGIFPTVWHSNPILGVHQTRCPPVGRKSAEVYSIKETLVA